MLLLVLLANLSWAAATHGPASHLLARKSTEVVKNASSNPAPPSGERSEHDGCSLCGTLSASIGFAAEVAAPLVAPLEASPILPERELPFVAQDRWSSAPSRAPPHDSFLHV